MFKAKNIGDLLEFQAKKFPEKVFAVFPKKGRSLTYKELHEKSEAYSKYLDDSGLRKGHRVSIISSQSEQFLSVYFGLLKIGAIVHKFDEKLIISDLLKSLAILKPSFVILDAGKKDIRKTLEAELVGSSDIQFVYLGSHEETLTTGEQSTFKVLDEVGLDDPAICVMTSGSTGNPKGILSSHGNVLFAGDCLKCIGLTPEDKVLSITPLSGTNGQIFTVFAPLISGGSVVFFEGLFTSFGVFDLVEKYKITWINGTPSHISVFVNVPVRKEEVDYSSLKFIRSASAPLPKTVQKRFEASYDVPIIETMGLSEMTGQVFSNPSNIEERKLGSVGKPVRSELRILDDGGNEVETGIVGELVVKSDGLMIGYLDDPEETSRAIRNGWLHTGDLGYIDKDGFIFIKGRKKDIVIVGGVNVSLKEVDEVLYEHADIVHAVSFGVPDQVAGERIVGCVVLKKRSTATNKEIIRFCKSRTSLYKCPSEIHTVDDLPMGGSGKFLRFGIKKRYLEGAVT